MEGPSIPATTEAGVGSGGTAKVSSRGTAGPGNPPDVEPESLATAKAPGQPAEDQLCSAFAANMVALAEVEDVHILKDADSDFYREGTLEIMSGGKPVLTLEGVPEPESFREAVLNACRAWAPGKMKTPFIPAKKAE